MVSIGEGLWRGGLEIEVLEKGSHPNVDTGQKLNIQAYDGSFLYKSRLTEGGYRGYYVQFGKDMADSSCEFVAGNLGDSYVLARQIGTSNQYNYLTIVNHKLFVLEIPDYYPTTIF